MKIMKLKKKFLRKIKKFLIFKRKRFRKFIHIFKKKSKHTYGYYKFFLNNTKYKILSGKKIKLLTIFIRFLISN